LLHEERTFGIPIEGEQLWSIIEKQRRQIVYVVGFLNAAPAVALVSGSANIQQPPLEYLDQFNCDIRWAIHLSPFDNGNIQNGSIRRMWKIEDSNIDGDACLGCRPRSVIALEYYSLAVHLNQSVAGRTCRNELPLVL
jgi:hypothetical protein